VGKLRGKRPIKGPGRRWNENIKMHLQKEEWKSIDWINLAHEMDKRQAFVKAAMKLRVP
jgi:hypothetical protein